MYSRAMGGHLGMQDIIEHIHTIHIIGPCVRDLIRILCMRVLHQA